MNENEVQSPTNKDKIYLNQDRKLATSCCCWQTGWPATVWLRAALQNWSWWSKCDALSSGRSRSSGRNDVARRNKTWNPLFVRTEVGRLRSRLIHVGYWPEGSKIIFFQQRCKRLKFPNRLIWTRTRACCTPSCRYTRCLRCSCWSGPRDYVSRSFNHVTEVASLHVASRAVIPWICFKDRIWADLYHR